MTVSTNGEVIPTAADLRAEIARRRIVIYSIAPLIGAHPVTISRWLNGRKPLPDDVALRIEAAIKAAETGE